MSADDPLEPPRARSLWPLVLAYPVLLGVTLVWTSTESAPALVVAACCAAAILADVCLRISRRTRSGVLPVLVLIVLPTWGLVYNHGGRGDCQVSSCQVGDVAFRPLAEPEVYGLVALHLFTVLAYAVSRRRPGPLRPFAETLVHAALLAGVAVHGLLAVHFARWLPAAALFPPAFLPCASPILTVVLYGVELHARLLRRGIEAATRPPTQVPDSAYREAPLQNPLPPEPRVHGPTLARAGALVPVLLGVHAVVQAHWLGRADGAIRVVTGTCGHLLSAVPVEIIPAKCHYLCTVAARGHGWLVKPLRLGRRGGVTIVVNRQLALANAFEDLLHDRWPRFGRLARRAYDRVGLPVSRYLCRPLLADLVYLAMKPAEWVFYAALLLLDRGDPEDRIERMYR